MGPPICLAYESNIGRADCMGSAISAWRRCWLQDSPLSYLEKVQEATSSAFKPVQMRNKAVSIICFNARKLTSLLRDSCTSAKLQTSIRRAITGPEPYAHPSSGCRSSSHTRPGAVSETQSQAGRQAVVRKVTELNVRQDDDASEPPQTGRQS